MRKVIAAMAGTVFGSLLLVAAVAAANPTPSPSVTRGATGTTVATALGLTQAQVRDLRQDGLSLAQIAERQKVAVQTVVDALVARWHDRIDARVANGALTAAEAATLQAQLKDRAQTMVTSTEPVGMQGAAVGAGPRNGAGNGGSGAGNGDGTCDATGPHGNGRP